MAFPSTASENTSPPLDPRPTLLIHKHRHPKGGWLALLWDLVGEQGRESDALPPPPISLPACLALGQTPPLGHGCGSKGRCY